MIQWLRMRVLGTEIPYPVVTALLDYLDPTILHLFGLLFIYKFVAVTLLLFKSSKGTAMMISLRTHQFSCYFHTWFTL